MFEEKKENIIYPDYTDSILNLSCSIQRHFGITPAHPTLPNVDEILSHNYKHVVVILLDGLGINILEKHLTYRDFLRRHLLTEFSSVFLPTTTASTTTFLSGKSPIEHGWLGWDVYFEQENKSVTCFYNTLSNSNTPAAEYNIPNKYLPYENLIDQINNAKTAKANAIFPFETECCHDPKPKLKDWVEAIRQSTLTKDKTFTYAYWDDPDGIMHQQGTNSNDVAAVVRELNEKMTYLCEECPDTVFFITADHGHTDIRNVFIEEDYPEIANMLVRKPSLEPRAISFYVKPEFKEEFPAIFNKSFGDDYLLLTKDEVLKEGLFGPGYPNQNLTGLGDYIAIAYGERTILWNKKEKQFRSHHGGLTKNEMRIPLIWYVNKPKKIGLIIYYTVVAFIILFIFLALYQ